MKSVEMPSLELLRLHMALECISTDDSGDLIPVPCPNPDGIHRLYIAYTGHGYARFFRSDVPTDLRRALSELSTETLFHDHEMVKTRFASFGSPCPGIHVGKSYVYPDDFDPISLPDVILLPDDDRCAIEVDGELVSACSSSHANAQSAEAWVYTDEAHRQQGYGKRVVQAWAQRVRRSGRVPFYSHIATNIASQHLAESTGWHSYLEDVGYE